VASGAETRVLPDGVIDLMWYQERMVVAGADTSVMIARTRPGDVVWGYPLAPGAARELFGLSMHELTDHRVDLSDLVRPVGLPHPDDETDVPTALERTVAALWARADPSRARLRRAALLDRGARQGRSVQEMADLLGLSERSVHRLSVSTFGYGMKSLARIHRFRRALDLAREGMAWSEVAAVAGYADQPHLARECARLAGRTPTELRGSP